MADPDDSASPEASGPEAPPEQRPEPAAPAAPPRTPARQPAAWGDGILRIDMVWTRFETWLAVSVLGLEVVALSLWVVLKGFSTPSDSASVAGWVFRALFGATFLGTVPYVLLRKRGYKVQVAGALSGILVGILLARAWLGFGVDYTSNLLNWYQQGCSLTLFGGLRGIGTRLTLLLAILGGSLATARGKHITIDLVQRFASEKIRLPVVVAGWAGSAAICLVLAWGFFDHIAIENFGARAEETAPVKIKQVAHELDEGWFIFRKQMALDLKSTPHIVFRGEPYADWLGGKEWNQWLEEAGFVERYGKEAVEGLKIPEDDTRAPIVVIPGRGEPRGELIHPANLVYPIGFLIIALRFLIRSLLALSGHVSVDPDDSGDFTTDDAELEGKV